MKKHLPSVAHTVKRLGFTMIELLIVISILGILAVAVLSAINPIEQINRGRDTGSRSDAEQLLSAIDRFYAFNGYYPWQTGATDTAELPIATLTPLNGTELIANATALTVDTNNCSALAKLASGHSVDEDCTGSGSREIKNTFIDRITDSTYNTLSIYYHGVAGDSVYLCFRPKSEAFTTEATTRCGTTGSGLPSDLSPINADVCDLTEGATGDEPLICLP